MSGHAPRACRAVFAITGAVLLGSAATVASCVSFSGAPTTADGEAPAADGGAPAADAGADRPTGDDALDGGCPRTAGSAFRIRMGSRSFCIDTTEVTCGQESAFLAAVANGGAPRLPAACAPGTTVAPAVNRCSTVDPQVPVGHLSWCAAWAYCAWAGKRLCTAAEWLHACSGGDANRTYPYGSTFEATACSSPVQPFPEAVRSYPRCVTPEGIYDLSGNAREWLDCPGTGRDDPCSQTSASYDKLPSELSCRATTAASRSASPQTGYDWGVRCCAD